MNFDEFCIRKEIKIFAIEQKSWLYIKEEYSQMIFENCLISMHSC
jgi:hypothetical protein